LINSNVFCVVLYPYVSAHGELMLNYLLGVEVVEVLVE